MTRRRRDGGLTLIELVVAMAIFALVAAMGLQALTGAMRMRDRLVQIDEDTGALGLTLALLRADLGALVPLMFYPPDGPPGSALVLRDDMLGLSLAGQPELAERPGPGLARVEWRLSDGRLSRRSWPALYPAAAGQRSPETVLLTGVRGWSVRTHWPQVGWIEGTTGAASQASAEEPGADSDAGQGAVPESYSSDLPEAVELLLDTEAYGQIRLVESLK